MAPFPTSRSSVGSRTGAPAGRRRATFPVPPRPRSMRISRTARPFASRHPLMDYPAWGQLRPSRRSIGVKRPSSVVQPPPIPSFPARALSFLSKVSEPPDGSAFTLTYISASGPEINGRLCHLVLASPMLETLQMAGPLRSAGHYSASSLLRTQRHPPSSATSRFRRLYGYPAPTIRARDEEGFSSCLACPCHRAVASTPPR